MLDSKGIAESLHEPHPYSLKSASKDIMALLRVSEKLRFRGGDRRGAPGKNRSKMKGILSQREAFFRQGGFENRLRGKGVCPEVCAARRPRGNWTPPNPQYPKNHQSVFGPFWLASVHKKPPQGATRRILPLKGPNQAAASTNLGQAESIIPYEHLWLKFFQDTLPCHLQVSNVQKLWPSQSLSSSSITFGSSSC